MYFIFKFVIAAFYFSTLTLSLWRALCVCRWTKTSVLFCRHFFWFVVCVWGVLLCSRGWSREVCSVSGWGKDTHTHTSPLWLASKGHPVVVVDWGRRGWQGGRDVVQGLFLFVFCSVCLVIEVPIVKRRVFFFAKMMQKKKKKQRQAKLNTNQKLKKSVAQFEMNDKMLVRKRLTLDVYWKRFEKFKNKKKKPIKSVFKCESQCLYNYYYYNESNFFFSSVFSCLFWLFHVLYIRKRDYYYYYYFCWLFIKWREMKRKMRSPLLHPPTTLTPTKEANFCFRGVWFQICDFRWPFTFHFYLFHFVVDDMIKMSDTPWYIVIIIIISWLILLLLFVLFRDVSFNIYIYI